MFESAVRSLITNVFYLGERGAKLTSLNLSGNGVGDSDELLMYLIRHCPNLEKLYLRENRITSKAAILMGRELGEKGCSLSVLDLGSNPIGGEGIEAIGPGLASIQDLNLAGCSIGPRGLESIVDFLKSCHTLNLNGNPLTSESAQALGRLLEGGSLTHLNLAFCDLGDDGVSAIASSFQNLKFLDLRGNHITGRGGEAIFPNLRDIVELCLDRNSLGEEVAGAIRPGNLENLKVLSAADNALGDAALTSLAAAMLNVETLILDGNEIGDAGLESLVATRGLGLTKLSLWKNLIGDEGLIALSTSHMAQTLIELVLGKNKVTSAGIQAMEPSQFPNLKELYKRWSPKFGQFSSKVKL